MPTWGEIKEYARSKYNLSHDEEERISLVWEFDDGRTQQIGVSHFTAYEMDWIEFRSYVCKEADLNPRVALRKNADFPIGGLALDEDGDYFMVYSARLDSLDPDEFELPLRVIARVADSIEKEHTAKDDF